MNGETIGSLFSKSYSFLSFIHLALSLYISWFIVFLLDASLGSETVTMTMISTHSSKSSNYLGTSMGSVLIKATTVNAVSSRSSISLPICPVQRQCDQRAYQTYLNVVPPFFRVCDLCQLELKMKKRYGPPLVYRTVSDRNYPTIPYGKEMGYLNVPRISQSEHYLLLIMVASGAKEVERRALLRDFYQRLNPKSVRFIFITASNPQFNERVNQESWKFGDILQMNHMDSYHNLTLTTFGAIQYFSRFTRIADYFMKTDSDCTLNLPTILNRVQLFSSSVHYAGNCQYSGTYNTVYKWRKNYVPASLVRKDRYIRGYATGAGYIIRSWLLPRTALGIRHLRFIAHNEDVNVGKVMVMFGIRCVKLEKWVARHGCRSRDVCSRYAIIHPDGKGTPLRSYWNYIL